MTLKRGLLLLATIGILLTLPMAGCNNGSSSGPIILTLNPVLDFYINRSWNTDTDTNMGYGTDSSGNWATDETYSIVNSGTPNSLIITKQLFNFNISTLSGATIQSAYFRIYLNSVSGTPSNLVLENIFYGNTNSFPPAVRNYDNEFGGYIVTPSISSNPAATTVGWIQIDVTAKLQADITAARTNSQFRLTHQNITNLVTYECIWVMTDNATNKPELVITYTN
jgi:hypothetical protein